MKTFDFMKETQPITDNIRRMMTTGQRARASSNNCTRILRWRFATTLPQYVVKAGKDHGYKPILLGYTTFHSSTWGWTRKR